MVELGTDMELRSKINSKREKFSYPRCKEGMHSNGWNLLQDYYSASDIISSCRKNTKVVWLAHVSWSEPAIHYHYSINIAHADIVPTRSIYLKFAFLGNKQSGGAS